MALADIAAAARLNHRGGYEGILHEVQIGLGHLLHPAHRACDGVLGIRIEHRLRVAQQGRADRASLHDIDADRLDIHGQAAGIALGGHGNARDEAQARHGPQAQTATREREGGLVGVGRVCGEVLGEHQGAHQADSHGGEDGFGGDFARGDHGEGVAGGVDDVVELLCVVLGGGVEQGHNVGLGGGVVGEVAGETTRRGAGLQADGEGVGGELGDGGVNLGLVGAADVDGRAAFYGSFGDGVANARGAANDEDAGALELVVLGHDVKSKLIGGW